MSFLGSIFGTKQQTNVPMNHILDVVTYVASLASNPDDIDPMLDKMRAITASLGPNQELSKADEQTLLQVYRQIEEYLVTKEPIRTFTKEELRTRIAPELRAQIDGQEVTNKESVG